MPWRVTQMMSNEHAVVAWRKSSYSGNNGGDCIEVAPGFPGLVPVRDSKDPLGPALVFPAAAWESFVAAVREGDLPA
ncbi:DUF397 domain-containing protein [Kitasatospora sp. NPDC091335]|uniref:DUF397 domain-containing protein n=1 Tax=Kitasatospora sp. NPDC091335 TaxID=3364085 RepID=UPI00380D8D78